MTNVDVPRLDWDVHLKHPAVHAAYDDLEQLTLRTIALHPISLVPGDAAGCYCASRDAIHIFLDESLPLVAHSTVHELLHGILVEEGYCKIAAEVSYSVKQILSNDLQHPEIFRRMEGYGLDMGPYWEDWGQRMRSGLDEMKSTAVTPFDSWWHLPRLFTWFFQPVWEPYLTEYLECCPKVYQAARAAYEDTKGVGFRDVPSQRKSVEIFKEHWVKFCDGHHLEHWACTIRDAKIRAMIDLERERSDPQLIMSLNRSRDRHS